MEDEAVGNRQACDEVQGLTAEQFETLEREGYLVVEDVIDFDEYSTR